MIADAHSTRQERAERGMSGSLPSEMGAREQLDSSDVETAFVGGLTRSEGGTYTWPLIKLLATADRLTFSARFGLGRLVGPWHLDRKQINAVSPAEGLQLGVEILGTEGQRWVFLTVQSEKVTRDLGALGYPIEV